MSREGNFPHPGLLLQDLRASVSLNLVPDPFPCHTLVPALSKRTHTKMCMFLVSAVSVTAQIWKQLGCLSVGGWVIMLWDRAALLSIRKMWVTNTHRRIGYKYTKGVRHKGL